MKSRETVNDVPRGSETRRPRDPMFDRKREAVRRRPTKPSLFTWMNSPDWAWRMAYRA